MMASQPEIMLLAEGLGKRPEKGLVEESREALGRIESELSLMMKAIAALPAPSDMDFGHWQAAKAAMEMEAKKDAEKQSLPYKSVIQLEELHKIYEKVVNETKMAVDETQKADTELKSALEKAEMKIAAAVKEEGRRRNGTVKLDLSGILLEKVPDSLQTLWSTLVKLDISNNNLEYLPESVTSLVNLLSLDVHSNQLTALPESIGLLEKLRVLNVSGNSLTAFPETIENCCALEELIANFNQLERLPEKLGFRLKKIRKLSVHSNKLSHLPPSTSYMVSLRVLDAHLNKLRVLPADIDHLVNLETLNISKNFQYLVALPDSMGGLKSLLELDVSYNQISTLPDSIGDLEKLQRLVLEGNPLVIPPPEIVEHSVEAVKHYMKQHFKGSRGKKSFLGIGTSWVKQVITGEYWVKSCVKPNNNGVVKMQRVLSWDEYRRVETSPSASPRFLSPRRLLNISRSLSTPRQVPSHLQSPNNIV